MRPRSSIRRGLVLAALLGGPAVLPSAGWAATPDVCQADRSCKEQTARAAQLAGQTLYEEALALYQSAYDRSHEPRLLVNLGRCHYRLGRARKALESYAAFQKAEPAPEPELEARLGQFIAEAKLAVASDAAGQPEAGKVPPRSGTSSTVELFVPAASPTDEPSPAGSSEPSGRRTIGGRPVYRVVLGASALGVGLTLLGLGVGALSANGQCVTPSDSSVNQCALLYGPDGAPYTRVLDGLTPGIPLLVVGVALSAGGIALIAVPPKKPAGGAGDRR